MKGLSMGFEDCGADLLGEGGRGGGGAKRENQDNI